MRTPISGPIEPVRRRMVLALPLLACGLAVAPVQARTGVHQSSRALMGTRVDLTLQGADTPALAAAAEAAFAEMVRQADMMSRYRPTSVVSAINLSAGLQPVPVPPELLRVLLMARQAAQTSGGAFDATVGALRDWNFDSNHPSIPSAQQISAQLRLVDFKGLVIDERRHCLPCNQRHAPGSGWHCQAPHSSGRHAQTTGIRGEQRDAQRRRRRAGVGAVE